MSGITVYAGTESQRLARILKRIGDTLQRWQNIIRRVQWGFVLIYLFLLIVPAILPAPTVNVRIFESLGRFSEALFWGLWWPGVILTTMLFGRLWCGLLCPDGAVTEFVSKHGKAWKIPASLRWPVWPLAIFSLISIYEQLIDAHRFPRGTLLILGATSLLAALTGLFYGRSKRVWCRYLCPVGSIFSMLARCAVLHYSVDRATWDAAPRPVPKPVDCPPLLDVRRLTSNEKCNMCGRCSGYRQAVVLAARPLGHEVENLREDEIRGWEAIGICFVLIGLSYGTLHWQGSPWHTDMKHLLDALLPDGPYWIRSAAPGWALGNTNGRMTWLSGIAALTAIFLSALALGVGTILLLLAAALSQPQLVVRLAYGLIPLAGLGLFLGALEHSLLILESEGWPVLSALPWLRAAVLTAAILWSGRIGWRLFQRQNLSPAKKAFGFAGYSATLLLLALCYQLAPIALLT